MTKDIVELIELAKTHFPSGWSALLLLLIVVGVLIGLWHLVQPFKRYEYFSDKREKEYLPAKDLLMMGKLSKSTELLLIEYLEKFTFNKYYGINSEKIEREILIKFHKKNEKKLSWKEIKLAIRYIRIKDDEIIVNFGKLDKFLYYATYAAAGFMFLICLISLYLLHNHIFHQTKNYFIFTILLSSIIVTFFFGIALFKSNLIDAAAIKIKKIL